jgi:hypothetical protein
VPSVLDFAHVDEGVGGGLGDRWLCDLALELKDCVQMLDAYAFV